MGTCTALGFDRLIELAKAAVGAGDIEKAEELLKQANDIREIGKGAGVIRPRSEEWAAVQAQQRAIDGVNEAIRKAVNA